MSKLAVAGAVALLVVYGASPVFAQAAIQEPGLYGFYHPDGDLSGNQPQLRSLYSMQAFAPNLNAAPVVRDARPRVAITRYREWSWLHAEENGKCARHSCAQEPRLSLRVAYR
jgi:hypothetical protein